MRNALRDAIIAIVFLTGIMTFIKYAHSAEDYERWTDENGIIQESTWSWGDKTHKFTDYEWGSYEWKLDGRPMDSHLEVRNDSKRS